MQFPKPLKLKKKKVVWYTLKKSGTYINSGTPLAGGEKHTYMTQPLWYFPFSVDVSFAGKQGLAIGVAGGIVKYLLIVKLFKKNKAILSIKFGTTGHVLTGCKKFFVWLEK